MLLTVCRLHISCLSAMRLTGVLSSALSVFCIRTYNGGRVPKAESAFVYISLSGLASDCAAGGMFPASYNMSIINAQHGSWDRTPKLGYRVMVLNLNEDGLALNYSALAEGWLLPNGTTWGEFVQPHLPCRLPSLYHSCCKRCQCRSRKARFGLDRKTCC